MSLFYILSILAEAEIAAVGGDLLKILTGAGGAIIVSYKWIQRESNRADEAQKRVDVISDKAITALTEVSIFLADTSKHLESVGGVVNAQHVKTREHVTTTILELKTNGPSQ